MRRFFRTGLLAVALLSSQLSARAEDIDLFVNTAAASTADVPNVLFIVDNTANWNSAFTNEIAALAATFAGLPDNKFRIGIMLAGETGGGNNSVDGGYVRAAIRLMDSSNKTKYRALINSLDKLDDKGNGGKSSMVMAEAYRYFSAGAPVAGNGKVKTDYTLNTNGGTTASNAIYAIAGNALASKDATTYLTPISGTCQKNYIIYISNGAASDNSTVTAASEALLTAAGGSITQIPISPSGSQSNVMDEWARFMEKSSLGVITYTIDVDPATSGQGPGWTSLLKSMAGDSSRYFAVNSATSGGASITNAVNDALSQIQSVNSVFAAVSLPVSVNTQGTFLNQVYIGLFRPDPSGLPRWDGNMKQYKLGLIGTSLKLEDADSAAAINTQTGFIGECARSFWTPTTADNYWSFNPQGKCLTKPGSDVSNSPDGNVVEKGAQAYMLRSTTTRTVKTCSSVFASCTALTDFDNSTVTQAMLGAASTTERDTLINWARGLDTEDENRNGTTITETRSDVHGDVVHSRPIALNFGTATVPSVVVFYGGNDGMLRAINGNRTGNIGSVTPGSELWAFMPPEFYGSIKRLRDNTTQISYPNIIGGSPKPYGLDGPIAAYQDSTNAWIYASMRRGGRALYAFDVTTPGSPSLKWKIGCPNSSDDTGCTSGLTGIGQTWSTPQTLKAAGYPSGAATGSEQPMLIMGGGYDRCEDSDPHTCTTSTKGNKIYVLDANLGTVLHTLSTDRAVVGDIAVIPDSTGLAIYAYAADLGGNVYRITVGTATAGSWSITKIASLGCASATTCTNNRKFMFGPDVVEESGTYVLLLGSGDREKPVASYTSAKNTTNYFFKLTDKPSDSTWLTNEASNCSSSVMCLNSLVGITTTATPTQAALDAKKGWYLGLAATEQVVTSSITIYGTTTFSTHQPAVAVAGSCGSNLGTANVYNIAYINAASANGTVAPSGGTASRFEKVAGGGLSPSPKAGVVILDGNEAQPATALAPAKAAKTTTFIIGGSASSPIEAKEPPLPPNSGTNQPKTRVYWYIQK